MPKETSANRREGERSGRTHARSHTCQRQKTRKLRIGRRKSQSVQWKRMRLI